ncbi:hypothetical protein HDV05_002647 [Chytridiales sp. JEL 0842]|nr:hypothetical protein HDV05_002647 [Chytridiales sp. JEL 0842]
MPYLTATSPGVRFDVYNSPGSSYPTLGIPVATFGAGGGAAPAPAPPAGNTTTPATPAPAPPATPPAAPAPAPPAAPPAAPLPPCEGAPAPRPPPSCPPGTTPARPAQTFDAGSGVTVTTKGVDYCWTVGNGQVTGLISLDITSTTSTLSSITASLEGATGMAVGYSWNAAPGSMKMAGANSLSFGMMQNQNVVGMMVNLEGVVCGPDNKLVTPLKLAFKAGTAAARR